MQDREAFDRLVSEALHQEFSGWDFTYLKDRWKETPTSWDYAQILRDHIRPELTLLDMDTGGGEVLSSLMPLPKNTYATEGYIPNVPVASARLEPLGVKVVQLFGDDKLPFKNDAFDLVVNRHGSYIPGELYRVMKPSGRFITQQVGGRNNFELNKLLQENPTFKYSYWTLELARQQLTEAGFEILEQKDEYPETIVSDIGALVFHLKVISWQIGDFSVQKYHDKLLSLHHSMQEHGGLKIRSHRFLIVAARK